jgi:hypothetical protein
MDNSAFTDQDKQNTNDFLKKVFHISSPDTLKKDDQEKTKEDTNKGESKGPEEKGLDEALQESVKDEELAKQKLDNLIENSDRQLLRLTNSRLFNLRPDELIIDTTKVSVIFRQFLGSNQIKTIAIKDLTEVILEYAPIFATLKLRDARFDMDEDGHLLTIKHLSKNDAKRAYNILQGLLVAKKEDLEISQIYSEDLPQKIEELGRAATPKS